MITSLFQTILVFIGIFYTGFMLEYQGMGLSSFDLDREEIRWNWDNININAREIAIRIKRHTKEFDWGTATAAHQVEGNNTNNWSEFEKIPGKILNGDKSGEACQHYTRFRSDFDLMSRELSVNAYRFSIEWSRIQPNRERGKFSEKETRYYHTFIDELIRRGIKPMATLHHFSHPIWFEEMGSFTKSENIVWFTEFSEYVFKEYSSKVELWCTFNEMSVLMTAGYFGGVHAPGKTDTQLGLTFSGNVIRAHTETYFKLKSLPNGPRAKIGMVHAYHQFDPYSTWNPLQRALCNTMDHIYNAATLEYFKTGKYSISVPFIGNVEYNNPNGPKSQDFIGLNYYSHYHVQLNYDVNRPFILAVKPEYKWLMTDMNYTIYGEGFYRAIKRYGRVGVPVHITENGLADRNDTYIRDLYLKRYLYGLSKAVEEGVDVRSYYFWSFMDNFEWAEGFDKRFGLYHTDYRTQRRTLRRGAKFYIDVINEYKKLSKKK